MYSNDKWTSCVLLEFNMPFLSKREKVLKYQLPLCLVAILASLKLLIIMDLIFNRPKRKDPRWRYKERKISGHYTKLVLRSRTLRDTETFKDFLRMTPETFDSLLRLIGPSLLRQDTKMKEAISPSERLAVIH